MPVSQHGNKLAGQSEMGGVWEWTSTTLDKHEGFEAMPLYPGYTGKGRWYIHLLKPFLTCLHSRLLRW
jgi:formylglycine-generating enzyme required for sulfatase activity